MKTVTQPKTLLAHANVPTAEIDFSRAALVLVDYQKEYTEGALSLSGSEAALDVARDLVDAFREMDAPVIHVVHHARPGSALFDPLTDRVDIVEAVAPAPGEAVVEKTLPSAFNGTTLEEELRAAGRTQVVVVGFMTHMCVESTARAAAELGFQVILAGDACATRDLPRPGGAAADVVAASALHEATLAALSDRFATVLTGADVTKVAAGARVKESAA